MPLDRRRLQLEKPAELFAKAHASVDILLGARVLRRSRFFWCLSSNRDFALRARYADRTADSPNKGFCPSMYGLTMI